MSCEASSAVTWIQMIMLALLAVLPLVASQSIQIAVSSTDGVKTPAMFTAHSLKKQELLTEAQQFCVSIAADNDCGQVLYDQILNRRLKSGIWSQTQLVLSQFTRELVTAECESWSTRGYATESDCNVQADTAVRSVKAANAFPMVDQLISIVRNNELVSLAADWEDGIEGNTFGYVAKVHFLQTLADDDRVQHICEIGFNLGHSVSIYLCMTLVFMAAVYVLLLVD